MSTLSSRLLEVSKNLPRGWKAKLARACGVKPPSVSDWVTGKTISMEWGHALKAGAFFKANPEWIYNGKGKKYLSGTDVVQFNPQHEEEKDPIISDLAALKPAVAESWKCKLESLEAQIKSVRADIRAAADEVRQKQEEDRAKPKKVIDDPPLITKRTACS